eukprot:TRINITY_DN137_c0_g1_i6.p1 TRINITY_DN137_c0_g1~~TRINITY_DN137_c0_g1_i6.p1  ORF type:complete len:363 (+),score=56.19 TRINITY_DN137_c0_g1_i6:75-1163(+)
MAGLRLALIVQLPFALLAGLPLMDAKATEDATVAKIYDRPMAGLMVPAENFVNCSRDEEDFAFWVGLLSDPELKKSVVEELLLQANLTSTDVNMSNSSDVLLALSSFDPWNPWAWHHHHGFNPWGPHGHHGWGPHGHHGHHGHWRLLRGAANRSSNGSGSFKGSSDGSEASDCEVSDCCNAEGYGEMAPEAVEALALYLNLSTSPTDSFFDLGSGAGRLVLHMAVRGFARSSTGVELNSGRHALAVNLSKHVLPEDMSVTSGVVSSTNSVSESGVTLLHGDMLLANISSATLLYLNPPCLPCEVQRRLTAKILQESHAQHIVTSAALNGLIASGQFVEERTEFFRPMIGYTWEIPFFVYRRA